MSAIDQSAPSTGNRHRKGLGSQRFLRTVRFEQEDMQRWWDALSDEQRQDVFGKSLLGEPTSPEDADMLAQLVLLWLRDQDDRPAWPLWVAFVVLALLGVVTDVFFGEEFTLPVLGAGFGMWIGLRIRRRREWARYDELRLAATAR